MNDRQRAQAETQLLAQREQADAEKKQREEALAAGQAAAQAAGDGFVKMVKLGMDVIEVHPSCVKSHVEAGWTVVG